MNNGLQYKNVLSLAVNGTDVFAGTDGGVFLSADSGAHWNDRSNGLFDPAVMSLSVSGTNIYAGGAFGFSRSTDNGITWRTLRTNLPSGMVLCFANFGKDIFIIKAGSGIFHSSNDGTSWDSVHDNITKYQNVSSLIVKDQYLYVGTFGYGIWKRSLSEMTTSVDRLSIDMPKHFSLAQNYPNPFNPSTTIFFSLPSKSFVSLKVFDLIGRETAIIVSEEMSAGNYSKRWNAVGMPSGIYFCRLQAGSFTETKKFVLLR
jgi:hypothetical protein